MTQHAGDRVPAPLRFEFGSVATGDTARAVLLATVDEDGSPRLAVLSTAEVNVADDRHLLVDVRGGSRSCANLKERRKTAVWYVLDAAAYTVKGTATLANDVDGGQWCRFEIEVESVWRDFEAGSPMISGPTYRVRGAD